MKKIFGVFVVLFIILAAPTLFLGWSLVDDGKSAQIAHDLTQRLSVGNIQLFINTLLEPDIGRFRPGYWIFLWGTFLIGGSNAFIHHFIHLVLFASSTWFVYYFAKELSSKRSVGILASILFICDWQIIENWYRLGTQEPITLPLLMGSLYFFILSRKDSKKVKLFVSIALAIYALLVKETNLAYLSIPLYFLVADLLLKNKKFVKHDLVYFLSIGVAAVVFRILASNMVGLEGYASLYEINFQSIISNIRNYLTMFRNGYSPLLEIVVITIFIKVAYVIRRKGIAFALNHYYIHGIWFVWFAAFLVIQIPWGFTIGRYLLIAIVGFHILISDTFVSILDFINRCLNQVEIKKRMDFSMVFYMLKSVLFITLPLVLFYQIFMSINYIYWVVSIDRFNSTFINALVDNASQNGNVYLNAEHIVSPPLELYYEIDWHFDYLFDRTDINYDYLKEETILGTGDLIAFHTATPMFNESMFQNEKYQLVADNSTDASNLIITTPMGIMKGILRMTISGSESVDKSSFVATSSNHYRWVIYKAK